MPVVGTSSKGSGYHPLRHGWPKPWSPQVVLSWLHLHSLQVAFGDGRVPLHSVGWFVGQPVMHSSHGVSVHDAGGVLPVRTSKMHR